MIKRKKLSIFLLIIFILICVGFYNTHKSMPTNLNYASEEININPDNLEFLYDLTYENEKNEIESKQMIFDKIINNIKNAKKYILIDMFLFNSWLGKSSESYRELSGEISNALIEQKKLFPNLKIDFITDPINTVYSGLTAPEIKVLQENDINVIITNHKPLRDSNPIYSSLWRPVLQWVGKLFNQKLLSNPFSPKTEKVSINNYLTLLNFKANHRKIFLSDSNDSTTIIITSANPHDASSAHSNVALEIKGSSLWEYLLKSEDAVAALSKQKFTNSPVFFSDTTGSSTKIKLLSENQIKQDLIKNIESTSANDQIKIGMFYLADRNIINSLINASFRGVDIKIILDPNKDAFGYEKNGIPNRQVANELINKSNQNIKIRWYNTHGEQFHSKITYIKKTNGNNYLSLGSANFTRRNLDNYNLETNIALSIPNNTKISQDIEMYFEKIWNNEDYNGYTLSYKAYKDTSKWKYFLYRVQESLGLSSF